MLGAEDQGPPENHMRSMDLERKLYEDLHTDVTRCPYQILEPAPQVMGAPQATENTQG